MAKNSLVRRIIAIFDRESAKKTEAEMAQSLGDAGKKGGANFVRELRAAFDKTLADLKVKLAKGLIDPKQFKAAGDRAAKEFNSGVIAGMEKARAAGTLTDKEYLKLARTLKKVGDDGADAGSLIQRSFLKVGTLIAGAFAFHKLTALVADSVHAELKQEESITRLDGLLKPLGRSYASVKHEVEGYLDTLQKTTRFSSGDGREALGNLIVATGSYTKAIRLMDVTAKIAEKRHSTLAAEAQTAADASRGLTKGMKDLGISAGDTGDLIEKINRNLGDLAVEGGQTKGGKIAILKNLLDEVKTSFGGAILGGTGFASATRDVTAALDDLNTWIKANSGTISDFSSLLIGIARAVGFAQSIGTFIPRQLLSVGRRIQGQTPQEREAEHAQDEALVDARARAQAVIDRKKKFSEHPGKTKEEEEAIAAAKAKAAAEEEARAKRIADELQRIADDTAVHRLMVEQDLTEALAREMVRRGKILAEATEKERKQFIKGWQQQDTAALVAKALGEGPSGKAKLTPGIAGMQELLAPPSVLPAAQHQAKAFESVWTKALKNIEQEASDQGTLFAELGMAWAEGGFKGIAELAKRKVKENLAYVIEEGAKAIASLALGNPLAAERHAEAAVAHGAAAAAWGGVAAASGGSGGGGGAGGFGAGGQGPTQQSAVAPTQEIHLHYRGPKAFSPEMEDVVVGNIQGAKERYGNNVKIIVHKGG